MHWFSMGSYEISDYNAPKDIGLSKSNRFDKLKLYERMQESSSNKLKIIPIKVGDKNRIKELKKAYENRKNLIK